MGYNTAVIILNDCLSDIAADPELGLKLSRAIQGSFAGERSHLNAVKVVTSQHADFDTVVVMHGNTGKVLNPYAHKSRRVSGEDAERILKSLAEMYGYKLVKV